MAEDAEDRFKRAMDRLFSSPATPPPSNTGEKKETSTGNKPISTSYQTAMSHRLAENSPLEAKLPSNLYKACRPWDRGDLFRRFATFKSMTWFGKPEVAGPVNCARNGWVNVDIDLIACEGCNAMLSFPCPPIWSQQEAESAATSFSEKLESGHKSLCPWKGNACSETLAQFPPTPVEVLVEGFKDRCDELYRLSALPVLSSAAIESLKKLRGPQMDRFMSQAGSSGLMNGIADGAVEDSIATAACTYYQTQKIISLCGWELRLLPYVVDCQDDNTESVKKIPDSKYPRPMDSGPKVLLYASKTEKREISNKSLYQEQKCDVASAVLDCTLCGASVGLWLFSVVPRPSAWITTESAKADTAPMACGLSAASGIQRGSHNDPKGEANVRDAATSSLSKVDSVTAHVLNLNLTIAGGPRPTQMNLLNSKSLWPSVNHSDTSKIKTNEIIKPQEERDGYDRIIKKRKRTENTGLDDRDATERKMRILPCHSSVDAVDTCFLNRRENSAESVEMPEGSHAMSGEDSDRITQRSISAPALEHTNSSKDVGSSGYKSNVSPMVELKEKNASHASTGDNAAVEGNAYEKNSQEEGVTLGHSRRMPTDKGSFKGHESVVGDSIKSEKGSSLRKLLDESSKEFDPVLQHRHFCPWVNTNLGRGSYGWQLTLDALEASPIIMQSESESSMYNADPLSSVRKIFGRSATGQKLSKK